MRVGEMHALFTLRMQELDAERMTYLMPGAVDAYLNMAQYDIVKERASQLSSGETTSDLAPLIRNEGSVPVIAGETFPGGNETEPQVPTPGDLAYLLRCEASIIRSRDPFIGQAEYVPCDMIQESDIESYKVHPDNDPWIPNPGAIQREDFIHIYHDADTSVGFVNLVYVRNPPDIKLDENDDYYNRDSQLPEHLHRDIVSRALQLALTDNIPKVNP